MKGLKATFGSLRHAPSSTRSKKDKNGKEKDQTNGSSSTAAATTATATNGNTTNGTNGKVMSEEHAHENVPAIPVAVRMTGIQGRPKPHVGPSIKEYQKFHASTVGKDSDEFWRKVSAVLGLFFNLLFILLYSPFSTLYSLISIHPTSFIPYSSLVVFDVLGNFEPCRLPRPLRRSTHYAHWPTSIGPMTKPSTRPNITNSLTSFTFLHYPCISLLTKFP